MKDRIAVFCSAGAKRSNLLAFHLKAQGYDAIPCGMDMNSQETIELLCAWADQIVLAQHLPQWYAKIPAAFHYKVRKDVEIGPDVWAERWHQDLELICLREATKFG